MVKPVTNYVGTYVTMWDRILQDKSMDTWLAMNKWVNDGVPFPGAAFKQWIREFYQQNKLVKGQIFLRGRRVDLSRITCPVLNIAGKRDHICTLPQAEATMRLIGSKDKEFFCPGRWTCRPCDRFRCQEESVASSEKLVRASFKIVKR